ncbi:phage gp6-like head-tail connector protein [Lactobacillus helveticus]|uniref:head-tail connector protein n=1 Tax=Lactobacillus helveticus TaxID=1587 RepID=UPI001C1E4080|nr:head-tail connector protein [Lactobacillus helveticus]MBU5980044.1 head-tail connector protein [Lactobacillus helveticus]MCT3413387.1 phage gp6-like head-tail connector protein [Lactobacillus helveticus]
MTTFLEVDDEFKRVLGYLSNDDMLDDQVIQRMISALNAAEIYVQGAVGQEKTGFYQSEKILPLYKLACFAIAANWFNHPSTAVSSTTAKAIIGQLRGSYDESEVSDDGSIAKS